MQEKMARMYALTKGEYPAPTKAMWNIMGRPVGNPRLPNRPVTAERPRNSKVSSTGSAFSRPSNTAGTPKLPPELQPDTTEL